MNKFLKHSILFALPIIILICLFIIADPFRIIHHYDDYSKNMDVIPNRDFVSSKMYLNNKDMHNYDSFIFGSSRTLGFKTQTWQKYIPKKSSPFVFDASGESLFGIYTKIKFIDETNNELNNALIILCTDCTFALETDHTGHLGIKYPKIAKTSWINFYTTFIKAFFDFKFLKAYLHYLATGKYTPAMKGYIEYRNINYNIITNDLSINDLEYEINKNAKKFYSKRREIFYERDTCDLIAKPQITRKHKEMLTEIKSILNKHNTKYKIVISPLYNQIRFDESDLKFISYTFGYENLYDFSGKNVFTEKKENYYEASHYRPLVGDSIFKSIYPSDIAN